MGLTIRLAADKCGRSRTTIHRALKNGKLSGQRLEGGAWSIDPAELARVFPWDVTGDSKEDTSEQQRDTQKEVLETKVLMLEDQLTRERETVEDLRKRLDKAEDRILALSPPPQHGTQPNPQGRPDASLWGRVRFLIKGNAE